MESIWAKTCEIPPRESLPGDVITQVAVIGAGMAGVLIAAALQESGYQVVVLEAGRIGGGQTHNTTAKLTSQHGPIYRGLLETLGERKASQYAQANETALRAYRNLIVRRGIDCDFQEQENFVYGGDAQTLRAEAGAAARLGLPADFVEDTPLPFPAAGAVRFSRQAQFHPLKFLRAMAGELTIYEHTPVITVEDDTIVTHLGRVKAQYIVFATHYPFLNFPGLYFARMYQERSYVLALENVPAIPGMWIGDASYSDSFRMYGNLLLLGGAGHRTGDNREGGRYETLRQKAAQWFPQAREVTRWSAQDCIPADGVPYIGPYAASRPNWYVATGFQKWGMTSSMVSALILRDLIRGRNSPYAEVFDPGRFDLSAAAGVAKEGKEAVKGLTKRIFQIPEAQAAEIPKGHGGVVFLNGEKVGVYKDEEGRLYPVEIRCAHLGCQLEWNPDERTWDCPCHGSRYDRFGNLISGPAQEGIKRAKSGQ